MITYHWREEGPTTKKSTWSVNVWVNDRAAMMTTVERTFASSLALSLESHCVWTAHWVLIQCSRITRDNRLKTKTKANNSSQNADKSPIFVLSCSFSSSSPSLSHSLAHTLRPPRSIPLSIVMLKCFIKRNLIFQVAGGRIDDTIRVCVAHIPLFFVAHINWMKFHFWLFSIEWMKRCWRPAHCYCRIRKKLNRCSRSNNPSNWLVMCNCWHSFGRIFWIAPANRHGYDLLILISLHSFMCRNGDFHTGSIDLQVEWLELFMYKYEALIKEPGFSANNEQ